MKIQINSLEALERLIGGDTEIEIEVRNSIVQEFTKTHLKALVNSEILAKFWAQVKTETTDILFDRVKNQWGGGTNLVLSAEAKKLIDTEFINKASFSISERLSKIIETDKIDAQIKDLIERQSQRIVDVMTDANIERRINQRVDQKIKEKFNLK